MNRDVILQGAYDSELRRMAGVVAVIWQLMLLAQVLIYLGNYRQPVVLFAVWLGMLGAAVWLVPRARAAGLTRGDAAIAVGVAIAAGKAGGAGTGHQPHGGAEHAEPHRE